MFAIFENRFEFFFFFFAFYRFQICNSFASEQVQEVKMFVFDFRREIKTGKIEIKHFILVKIIFVC